MPTHRTGTPKISVIIPTCQRPEDLQDALESIARQNIQGAGWETLVIDNAPCSKTVEVVDSFSTQIPNLKYIVEAEPGLLAARHAGMRHANADLLLYADDDIVASPDWVASVLKGFYQHGASIVGGSNLPLYGCPPPDWLDSLWVQDKDVEMLYQYSILKMRKDVPTPGIAWGCNFAIKKEALLAAGGFHPDGCPWNLVHSRSSGETHIYETVLRQGGTSLLMPGATVQHKVSKSRLTLQYLWKRGVAEGATSSATFLRSHGFSRGHFPGGIGAHAVFAKGFAAGFLFQRIACLFDAALVEWLLRSSYLSDAHIPCQPAQLPIPDDEVLQKEFSRVSPVSGAETIEDALTLALSIIPGQPKKAQLLASYALLLAGRTSDGARMLNLAALDSACKEPAQFIATCFGLHLQAQQKYQTESVRMLHENEHRLYQAGQPNASQAQEIASNLYNDNFYKERHSNTISAATKVLSIFLDFLCNDKPTSAIDIGCGVGTWLSILREKGITVSGYDGGWVPKKYLQIKENEFRETSLDVDLADRDSALWKSSPVDMLITLEVAEHLAPEAAPQLIDFITTHSKCALFSAAIPGQGGDGHINEQWPSYWANLFFQKRWCLLDVIRSEIWNDETIPFWYRQNCFVAVPQENARAALFDHKILNGKCDIVHPDLFQRVIR